MFFKGKWAWKLCICIVMVISFGSAGCLDANTIQQEKEFHKNKINELKSEFNEIVVLPEESTELNNSESKTDATADNFIKATVVRVVDGDTIKVDINGQENTVRLIGCDTPETVKPDHPVEPYGEEASAFTKGQLTDKTVYLEFDVSKTDKYDRMLTYVWTKKPTAIDDESIKANMFNARLLLDGYARLLTIPPDVKYVDYFTVYQQEAREGNKGLWGL